MSYRQMQSKRLSRRRRFMWPMNGVYFMTFFFCFFCTIVVAMKEFFSMISGVEEKEIFFTKFGMAKLTELGKMISLFVLSHQEKRERREENKLILRCIRRFKILRIAEVYHTSFDSILFSNLISLLRLFILKQKILSPPFPCGDAFSARDIWSFTTSMIWRISSFHMISNWLSHFHIAKCARGTKTPIRFPIGDFHSVCSAPLDFHDNDSAWTTWTLLFYYPFPLTRTKLLVTYCN